MRLLLAGLAFIVASMTGPAPSADASRERWAAPSAIVFSGGQLSRRIELTDWNENHQLMLSATGVVRVPDESLRARPRIDVIMYWGPRWRTSVRLQDPAPGLINHEGVQPGAFYPRSRGREALWVFGATGMAQASTRALSKEGLEILARHGIPVTAK